MFITEKNLIDLPAGRFQGILKQLIMESEDKDYIRAERHKRNLRLATRRQKKDVHSPKKQQLLVVKESNEKKDVEVTFKTGFVHFFQYQLQCKKCEAFYIGETGQMLSKRVNGHRSTCMVANSDLPIHTQSHQLPFPFRPHYT